MNAILAPLTELESFNVLAAALENEGTPALASGVVDSQKPHLIAGLLSRLHRPGAVITYSEAHAKGLHSDMRFFMGDRVKLYPSKDMLFYSADVGSATIAKQRLEVLDSLLLNGDITVIMSAEALLNRLAPREVFRKHIFTLTPGDVLAVSDLSARLVKMGYDRTELVEGPGQFAVRGGIFDIYPATCDNPVRLEFWDDEIDSLRVLDVVSQRSVEAIGSVRILPMGEDLESDQGSILDYLPAESVLFLDEPGRINVHIDTLMAEQGEGMQNRGLPMKTMVFDYGQVLERCKDFGIVCLSTLAASVRDFNLKTTAGFAVKSTGAFKFESLVGDMRYLCDSGYRVLFLAGAKSHGQRMAEELQDSGIPAAYIDDLEGKVLEKSMVTVTRGGLAHGFEYQHIGFAVITVASGERRRKAARRKKAAKIESFTDLKVGDYIVHDSHGIGVYKGIERIAVDDNVFRDYLKLQYADGGSLYIHTGQMEVLQKYIGGDEGRVKVNKLGGGEWLKAKTRAKKVVAELAGELVRLYARRQGSKGFVFSKDTVWQREFEDMTPFEETDDQLQAIADVKKDMESTKVMDRLICGDVGYGKTEIAIRAAFKAALDGKQVAYLAPTTILSQQHYNTFVQRMKDFPINIAMMSRFRSAKQNRETIDGLRGGLVDIVIGTHKVLSKDVVFKDLGLVIVDEEHRFGVTHKEKLKRLKENVDVLTLTATPIPRTLHMSLTGIRDMSTLEEPPQERLTVQTYVMEYDTELVREAINRELARDGQVYYLHNRVHNIGETAAKIQSLVPEAAVAYAHGQMAERELEGIMMDFIEGDIQVLVCTTIIESGLDIANVNTIIIENADCMGLAQLYQLRGRVGRSNRQAFAYFMYRKDKMLTEVAEKRLQTIRDFTEFGSGFKIAMRDLEIRGAGSILGAEQHGHIEAVGYDMYCRLLAEAVSELQGAPVVKAFETAIDLNINAFIPDGYISNQEQKLEVYKKISLISSERDFYDVQEEIEDRYGNLPEQVQNLLDISILKAHAHRLGMVSVSQKNGTVVMCFKPDADIEPEKLLALVNRNKDELVFLARSTPTLTYKTRGGVSAAVRLRQLLSEI